MQKVLITGARAPVALELARHFHHAGWMVYLADSVKAPLAKPSRSVSQTFYLSPPRTQLNDFIAQLVQIIQQQRIDLLVPTCEEIFFISRHFETLTRVCRVFCDPFEKLSLFHNKHLFVTELAKECGIFLPSTTRINTEAELVPFQNVSQDYVFKPVYSRFAVETKIRPTLKQLRKVIPSATKPWIAQQFIPGREYCSYSVAHEGRLLAHACYHPQYRVGTGSGIYLQPIHHLVIQNFVAQFVQRHHYTGQVGFDFIENANQETYVLECNPRATSGAHLFSFSDALVRAFEGQVTEVICPKDPRPKMIAAAMLIFGFPYGLFGEGFFKFIRHYRCAQDVIFLRSDPWPLFYQFAGLLEMVWKSVSQRISLLDAATADIEWDGEAL